MARVTRTRPAARGRSEARPVARVLTSWTTLLLAAIVALPLLLQLPFLSDPLWGDEGVYATVGRGILDGQIPYTDLFDNKPPLLYGWYALSFVLFGDEASSARLVVATVLSATALLVYVQGRAMFGPRLALAAAAIFGLSTAVPLINSDSSSESLMLLPMTGSLVAYTMALRKGRLRWLVAAGFLSGIAIMTKQVALWPLAALAVHLLIAGYAPGQALRVRIRAASMLAVGVALGAALPLGPLVLAGAFDDFIEANVRFNLALGADLTLSYRFSAMSRSLLLLAYTLGAPLLGAIAGWWLLARRRASTAGVNGALLFWAVGCAVGVASSGYFTRHHYVQLLPAMALLSTALLAIWLPRLRAHGIRTVDLALGGAGVALVALSLTVALPGYLASTPQERHTERSFRQPATELENANLALAAYVAANTRPDDTIFIHGGGTSSSPVYFYADRTPAASRFYHTVLRVAGQEEAFLATVATLDASPPPMIIDVTLRGTFDRWPERTPAEFWSLLDERYEYVGRVEYGDIYRLRVGDPES